MQKILILCLFSLTFQMLYPQQAGIKDMDQRLILSSNDQLPDTLPEEDPAIFIIRQLIKLKDQNDPEKALERYQYKSYNRLTIDRKNKTTPGETNALSINTGRSFLSEKVSTHVLQSGIKRELIEGIRTAGFKEPVYEVLSLRLQPMNLYEDIYSIYDVDYLSPLAKNAPGHYQYRLVGKVVNNGRTGYRIHFSHKRDRRLHRLEGILTVDSASYALQQARISLRGEVNFDIEHNYEYHPGQNLYFPSGSKLILRPGTAEKDISIFGGSITVGTVQRKNSALNILLQPVALEEDLYLSSTTTFFDLNLIDPVEIDPYSSRVKVLKEAGQRSVNYWAANRKEPFTIEDDLADLKVGSMMLIQNTARKIEVLQAISNGYYPIGFWNFELGRFLKYNNFEGIRLGVGGRTNDNFSDIVRLQGYMGYGFKDRIFKYSVGVGVRFNKRSDTWWNTAYTEDIREVANFEYIRGVKDFSILEPRGANISYFYRYKQLETGITHRITPRLDVEAVVGRSNISQTRDYLFFNDGQLYRDYTISEAKLGVLWRPFSKFISTPESQIMTDRGFPIVTAQLTRGLEGVLDGDFNFTKIGLKLDYGKRRLDRSFSQVTLEGNYGFGELPLTHAFHAYPNNPNKESIRARFSVAGNLSFETMYFNEFFSDRQAAIHFKHQFRPWYISPAFQPEFVLISRHVIGDFTDMDVHRNIEFNTLEHGYSEAGAEINKIFTGLGLSFAYRYGAYHLPTIKENISFKFTFQLSL